MSKKYYAVYQGQIKIDNEIFFGIDYKITDFINELMEQCKKQQEVIDKAIDFIKNGDLLYLANKNSIVYRNNIEIRAVADRLNDLLQILEDKEVK